MAFKIDPAGMDEIIEKIRKGDAPVRMSVRRMLEARWSELRTLMKEEGLTIGGLYQMFQAQYPDMKITERTFKGYWQLASKSHREKAEAPEKAVTAPVKPVSGAKAATADASHKAPEKPSYGPETPFQAQEKPAAASEKPAQERQPVQGQETPQAPEKQGEAVEKPAVAHVEPKAADAPEAPAADAEAKASSPPWLRTREDTRARSESLLQMALAKKARKEGMK